jgi:hypothetical protein
MIGLMVSEKQSIRQNLNEALINKSGEDFRKLSIRWIKSIVMLFEERYVIETRRLKRH